jgi:hypothetical protein
VSVVARRLASVPRRTSVETWLQVVELVTAEESEAREELLSVASVASMLIAEEYTQTAPITISGGGPVVRVYTLHGDEAIETDFADETDLAFDPTVGDAWLLSLPAQGTDVEVAQQAVAGAAHVEVRDVAEVERLAAIPTTNSQRELVLDLEELERP